MNIPEDRPSVELNALLEVTKAINENMPEESLYKVFYYTCISNLQINQLALVVIKDDIYLSKVCSGIKLGEESYKTLANIKHADYFYLQHDYKPFVGLEDVNVVVPIQHKKKRLAYVLLGGISHNKESDRKIAFVETLANIIMVAIENKRLARNEIEQKATQKEIEIARQVQTWLFPKHLPNTEKISLFANYLPNKIVGGDYYDYIPLSTGRFLVCIADVSGKGFPAAMLMSNFQACLRTLARQTEQIDYIVKELNHNVFQNANGEHFVTFFIGLYDLGNRTIEYINAGHNAPILLQGESELPIYLEKGTTVLGVFEELPFLHSEKIEVEHKSFLFCYTDGVTETMNNKGEEYGEERLINFLKKNFRSCAALKYLHEDLIIEIDTFKENQSFHDDLTILSCCLK